ncbi:MAG: molecular chaperone [Acidobacteriota bacterium]
MSDPMPTTTPSEPGRLPDADRLLARAALYRTISLLFADPVGGRGASPADLDLAQEAARLLDVADVAEAIERVRATAPATVSALRSLHTRVFGLLASSTAPPYEVEYSPRGDLFWRTQQLADIAGFYRAWSVRQEAAERPDHVAVEAEFLWYLLERQAGAVLHHHPSEKRSVLTSTFRAFFAEHFGSWVGSFARDLKTASARAEAPFFAAAADYLAALERIERTRLGLDAATPRLAHPSVAPPEEACTGCSGATPGSHT